MKFKLLDKEQLYKKDMILMNSNIYGYIEKLFHQDEKEWIEEQDRLGEVALPFLNEAVIRAEYFVPKANDIPEKRFSYYYWVAQDNDKTDYPDLELQVYDRNSDEDRVQFVFSCLCRNGVKTTEDEHIHFPKGDIKWSKRYDKVGEDNKQDVINMTLRLMSYVFWYYKYLQEHRKYEIRSVPRRERKEGAKKDRIYDRKSVITLGNKIYITSNCPSMLKTLREYHKTCWSVMGHYRNQKVKDGYRRVFVRPYLKGKDRNNSKLLDGKIIHVQEVV